MSTIIPAPARVIHVSPMTPGASTLIAQLTRTTVDLAQFLAVMLMIAMIILICFMVHYG